MKDRAIPPSGVTKWRKILGKPRVLPHFVNPSGGIALSFIGTYSHRDSSYVLVPEMSDIRLSYTLIIVVFYPLHRFENGRRNYVTIGINYGG